MPKFFYGKEFISFRILQLAFYALIKPAVSFLLITAVYLSLNLYFLPVYFANYPLLFILSKQLFLVGVFLISLWFSISLTASLSQYYKKWAMNKAVNYNPALISLIEQSIKIIIFLILVSLLLPAMNIPMHYADMLQKCVFMFIIMAIAWGIIRSLSIIEQSLLLRYRSKIADNLQARRSYTKIHVIQRIVIALVAVLALASILMLFESVRKVGASLLASAGLIGVIATFAAQRTLGGMFAGLQIAITQPLRIGDNIIVESEFGEVEEITLTYVVVKLWDLRRMVIPINYFIEKPFQNWTLNSSELIGSVFIYADYNLPVTTLRQEFEKIIKNSELWDGKVANLQVSDSKENTIEIRVLVSARNAGNTWDLRCYVREELIAFIQKNFPECLPKTRTDINVKQAEKLLGKTVQPKE